VKRVELEGRFLGDGEGPLDAPARVAIWPELATCYAALGQKDDAALAFAHAAASGTDVARDWLASETGHRVLTPERFDALLVAEPSNADARAVAAATVAGANEPWFASRLPAVQAYVAAHDAKLPVRIAWLVATRLTAVAGADELGLARARDRLLARLYDGGLNPERDLPTFLRYAGLKDSERARVVREKAYRLHAAVQAWAAKGLAAAPAGMDRVHTPALIDFAFAYAFARLQDSESAVRLLKKSMATLAPADGDTEFRNVALPVAVTAFRFRIEQTLAGRPAGGPLPDEIRSAYRVATSATDAPVTGATVLNAATNSQFALNTLLDHSRLLDPTDPKGAYDAHLARYGHAWYQTLERLGRFDRPDELVRRTRALLTKGIDGSPLAPSRRFEVVNKVLPLSGRAGETFAAELIELVPGTVDGVEDIPAAKAARQGVLLERALTIAAHFGRRDDVTGLIATFVRTLRSKPDVERFALVGSLGMAGLSHLRVLGLRDEADALLTVLKDELLAGGTVEQLRTRFAAKPREWSEALRALLVLAGGWLGLGRGDAAGPLIDVAAKELQHPNARFASLDMAKLMKSYVAACGADSPETGLGRVETLFETTDPLRIQNNQSFAALFSRWHYEIAEAVVMALTADEALGGLGGRRWRDEDEYLIRKQIHEDVRRPQRTS
jgi:hypothetical protein